MIPKIHKKFAYLTVHLSLSLIMAVSCSVKKPGEIDVTYPEIISISPQDGSTDVALNVEITVVFSEKVGNIEGTSTSFTLKKLGAVNDVPARVSFDSVTNTAVLTPYPDEPETDLEPDSLYAVTLTSEIVNIYGKNIENTVYSFTTGELADTEAPYILSRTPVPNSVNVSVDAVPQIVFSEPVTGVNSGSVFLRKTDSAQIVDSSVEYNEETYTVSLTPADSLEENTNYSLVVTVDVADLAGNPVVGEEYTFSTEDVTGPVIISRTPEPNMTGAGINTRILFTFSEDVRNVNRNTVLLLIAESGKSVPVTVVYDSATYSAVITPDIPDENHSTRYLNPDTIYTVSILSGITDASENSNQLDPEGGDGSGTVWSFETASELDTVRPYVTAKYPPDGTMNVAVDDSIYAEFSESVLGLNTASFAVYKMKTSLLTPPSYDSISGLVSFADSVDLSEVDAGDIYNDAAGTEFVITGSISNEAGSKGFSIGSGKNVNLGSSSFVRSSERLDGSLAAGGQTPFKCTFSPASGFEEMTYYSVRLTSLIADATGNQLNYSPVVWTFRTGDPNPPVISQRSPASGAVSVPTNTNVSVGFNEPVNGISSETFILEAEVSEGVWAPVSPVPLFVIENDREFYLNPKSDLVQETRYRVSVASSVTDFSGNSFAGEQWIFTTGTNPDTTPPEIFSAVPGAEAAGVELDANIVIKFTEPLNPSSVNTESIKLIGNSDNYTVSATVEYMESTSEATLNPIVDELNENTVYRVELLASGAGLRDYAGNYLSAASPIWTFTTKADETRPALNTRTPVDGETDVKRDLNVVVSFTEAVSNVDSNSFYLMSGSDKVYSVVEYDENSRTATLNPDSLLQLGYTYTVHLTSDITDRAAVPNELSPVSWSFTVTSDDVNPTVNADGTYPLDGNTDVDRNLTEIIITFSEAMDTGRSAAVLSGGPGVMGKGIWSNAGKTLTLPVLERMSANTDYTVSLKQFGSTFADEAGNLLDGNVNLLEYEYSFTTGGDSTHPQILSVFPEDGSTLAAVDRAVFRFSDRMNPSIGTVSLTGSGSTGTVIWSESGRVLTVPLSGITDGVYSLELNGFISHAGAELDLSALSDGNSLAFTVLGSPVELLAENFEGSSWQGSNYVFDSGCAFDNVSGDSYDWYPCVDSNNPPLASAIEGNYMIRAETIGLDQDEYILLESVAGESLDFSVEGQYVLYFKMCHENILSSSDRVIIEVSVNGGSYEAVQYSEIFRYNPLITGSPRVVTHAAVLTGYCGPSNTEVRLRLRAVSGGENGNDVLIDDIKVYRF